MLGLLASLAAVLSCLVAGAQAADSGWTVTSIGDSGFGAMAINDEGVVAGAVGLAPNYQAAVWSDGTTRLLSTPENTIGSIATGINNHGQMVGFAEVQTEEGTRQEAMLWDANGEVTGLGFLPGGSFSAGQDINDNGKVVGVTSISAQYRGFIWDGAGPIEALPMPTGATSSFAVAINAHDQIVGSSSAPFQPGRAIIWENGVATELDSLAEGAGASATDINNSGQIVGTSSGPPPPPGSPPPPSHAVLWSDGQVTDLGSLGGPFTIAQSINDDGLVVGLGMDAAFLFHAFVWKDSVLTLLPPLAGDREAAAFDINGGGQVVGWSRVPGPSTTAVMWASEKDAAEMVADLIAVVEGYQLRKLGTSLHDKLITVQRLLVDDKTDKACDGLTSFINQVKAQQGKGLSVDQAIELTARAQAIREVLGC